VEAALRALLDRAFGQAGRLHILAIAHLRAILGLPIPAIEPAGPSASAVILGDRESERFSYEGIADALALGAPRSPVDLRLFAKPNTLKGRRMGVALARSETAELAVERAKAAASRVRIRYQD
jgi:phosphoribosylglycinamide formyltransferase 2